jgi:hypothetical protein
MKKNHQLGFSLVETMIGVGLVGLVGLTVSQLLKNQSTSTKTTEIKSEYDGLISEIRSVLAKSDSCKSTFQGLDATNPMAGSVTSIKQVFDKTKPPLEKWRPMEQTNLGLLRINRYEFEPSEPGNPTIGIPADSVMGVVNLKVELGFDRRKKGGKSVTRRIRLNVETFSLTDRRIKSCVADASFSSLDSRYMKRTGGTMVGNLVMSDGTQILFESDKNLKHEITSLRNVLPKINLLNPVLFNWYYDGKLNHGFIAQEIVSIYPQIVKINNNNLTVDYAQFVPIVTQGIRELHSENIHLRQKVQKIKKKHEHLKRKFCIYEPTSSFCEDGK